MNVTPALYAGYGSEASGTFNISFRQGALGDWLFEQFVQPYYDIEYYRNQEEHYRRMTEIIHQRNEYQSGAPMGGMPSGDK